MGMYLFQNIGLYTSYFLFLVYGECDKHILLLVDRINTLHTSRSTYTIIIIILARTLASSNILYHVCYVQLDSRNPSRRAVCFLLY